MSVPQPVSACAHRSARVILMRMRTHRVIAALLLLALSAGCTSDPEPAAGPSPSPSPAAPSDVAAPSSPPVLEGPAAAGARWPDGVSAHLVAVQRVPNAWGVDVPASLAVVRLRLEVTNGGQEVLPLVPQSREMTLLYGPNRQEADGVTSYSYPDPAEQERKGLRADGGTRIPAGGKATFVESYLVPVAELGELAVVVEVPSTDGIRDPFTLTAVTVKIVK